MTGATRASAMALAGLLVVAGALFGRALAAPANYDEGVYLASLDALTHGQSLGTDVYASQPPGFYALLRGVSLLPGDGIEAIRVAFLLLAVAGLAAAFAIGLRLAGAWGGITAAGLLMVTAPYPVQAPRVQADTASVVLALCAVAVLMFAGRCVWRHLGAGALAGAALSVKLLAVPVVAPIVVLLVARRSWRLAAALAAGVAAVWAALLLAHAGAVSDLWQSVVVDHSDARNLGPSLADNLDRVLFHPVDWATPAGILVPVGLVCATVLLRHADALALGAWVLASAVFLVYQRPLLDHHLVLLAAVLAVTAGAGLGAAARRLPQAARYAAIAVGVLALAAGIAQEARRLGRLGGGEPADVRAAAAALHETVHPEELLATDLPIVAYLADRRLPGQLVDTSFVRFGTGSLTDRDVLAILRRDRIRAVAVGRLFADRPALMRGLASRYPRRVQVGGITLYLAP